MRRRRQRGQVLVLFALMAAVLLGFVGLVLDGGAAAADQETVRNAADGAALAAIYQVRASGSLATATTAAGQVVSADGLPSGDLTMTYLDSSGAVTSSAAAVVTAKATVSHLRSTFFLGLLGITSERLTASAGAAGSQSGGGAAACAVCVLGASGITVESGSNAAITITGAPLVVNSTGSPSISLGSHSSLSAPSITIAGGSPALGTGASITPAPVSGAPVADPFSSLAAPSVSGAPVAYVAPAGSSSLGPGVYSSITVATGSTLTLGSGVYVLTGPLTDAGTITGSGVLLYLACATYPLACASGAAGGSINVSGGSLTLSASASGTYAGVAVFADRSNSATSGASGSTLAVTGAWYTAAMTLRDSGSGAHLTFTQMVLSALLLANVDVLQASYSGGGGPATFGLTA